MPAQDTVLITRDSADEKPKRRVYITGPHFSRNVFSSTEDRAQATRFDRKEAERYLALGKWRGCNPQIEEA